MQRFFLEDILEKKQIILEDQEIIYQLTKVLRSKVGEQVIFFNGNDYFDFVYEISLIDKKNIILNFISKIQKSPERSLNLFQSLPNKIEKIELILQKGVEVGYTSFTFFKAKRSQDINISPNKIERFIKIIKEATEQSQRNIVASLNFEKKLDLSKISGQNIFFHTQKEKSIEISSLNFQNQTTNIFVGPEGGFDETEVIDFEKNNFKKVNLGNNILRTETTSVVVGFYVSQQKK